MQASQTHSGSVVRSERPLRVKMTTPFLRLAPAPEITSQTASRTFA